MQNNRGLQISLKAAVCTLAVALLFASPVLADDVAEVEISSTAVTWHSTEIAAGTEAAGVHLVVDGPEGVRITRDFAPGEAPSLSLFDEAGAALPDGVYTWEVKTLPIALRRSAVDESRRGLDSAGAFRGAYQAGYLTVRGGAFVVPQAEPARAAQARTEGKSLAERQTIAESLCVGFDCPATPTFGDTTLLLKFDNTRIKFDDDSTALGTFPNNDWELEANSSVDGGAEYFGLNDCGVSNQGGCADDLVFAVEAGAPASSLYVDDGGRVGLGTSSPTVELHVVDGDTPTLRLDQDNSSGFEAQLWDIAANETSFFIRDATNGSTLPFRIRPGASSNVLVIDSDDQVGIRDLEPSDYLDIDIDSNGGFTIESIADANLPQVTLLHPKRTWRFRVNSGGHFVFTDAGTGNAPMQIRGGSNNGLMVLNGNNVTVGGNLTVTGVKNFVQRDPVDPSRDLYYAALEGPEAGTYYRGSAKTVDGRAVIELPDVFSRITEAEGITIQLTSSGGMHQLYVEERSPERIVVREATGKDGAEFDFFVQGVRLGYGDYQVARPAGKNGGAAATPPPSAKGAD